MLTVAFGERLQSRGIMVNACHPGDVNSKLSNDLGFGGHESPETGAETPAWLAMCEEGSLKTGKYFARKREEPCSFGKDTASVADLYRRCLLY